MAYNIKPEKSILAAEYFSWVSMLTVFTAACLLTAFIGRSTLSYLHSSQEEYALLLGQNFNKQLFRLFTLPITIAGDSVSLSDPHQYRLLDETVESLVSGLRIESVKILDQDSRILYSTQYSPIPALEVEEVDASAFFDRLLPYRFVETKNVEYIDALFGADLPDGSFLLSLYYPLSVDRGLSAFYSDFSVLGLLKITIDITANYRNAIKMQRIIFLIFIVSSLLLFGLLQYITKRANRLIYERMEHNKSLEFQLHQQEKLASMGRMVASIAHEIRNPLGIICSSSELLQSRNKENLDRASKRILEAMIDEIKRLALVVNEFLDYAKPQQLKETHFNCSFSVKKALAFLENKIKSEEIFLTTDIEEDIFLLGDEELVYSAIYNIISNAIQALELKKIKQEDLLENIELSLLVSLKKTTTQVKFIVKDNGFGFTEEALAKALDPFFTTKDTGTGLGLPIVHSILETHKAKLHLYNSKEGGACVEVDFISL